MLQSHFKYVPSQVFRLNFQNKHFDIYFPSIDENNIYTANVSLSYYTSIHVFCNAIANGSNIAKFTMTVGHCPDFIFVTPSCTWISLSVIRHFLRIGYHKHRHECVATLSFPQSDTLNAFCHANAIRELQCFCLHLLE